MFLTAGLALPHSELRQDLTCGDPEMGVNLIIQSHIHIPGERRSFHHHLTPSAEIVACPGLPFLSDIKIPKFHLFSRLLPAKLILTIRISKPKSKKPPEISSHFSFFYDYFFFLVGFAFFSSVFLVYPAPKHRIILRHDH